MNQIVKPLYLKIMKKVYTILILMGLTFPLAGQTHYFNKTLLTSLAEQSVGVIELDSGYWFYGHQRDSLTIKQVDFLYKTDYQGNLLQKSSWGDPNVTYTAVMKSGISSTYDLNLVLGGAVVDTNSNWGFLMKVNKFGDTLWRKKYIDTISIRQGSWLNVRCVKQTPDSGFILAAQIYGDQPQETRCMLIKTDSLGNMQWYNNTYFSYNIETQPWEIVVTPDSGYLVVGYKWDGYDQNGWILKTDKYGTMQWQKVVGGQYDDIIYTACITPDGNIVVVLSDDFQYLSNLGIYASKIIAIKYTITGSVIWQKEHLCNISMNCRGIVALNDNSLVLTGYNYIIDSITQWDSEPSYIFKLNSQGDSIWFRHIVHHAPNHNYAPGLNKSTAIDMIRTIDNGFLVCGDYMQFPPKVVPQSSWLVKLDSLGCDTPGCHLVSIEERGRSIEGLEVFPNPFGDEMHLELPGLFGGGGLVMYDVQGGRVLEMEVPASQGYQPFTVQTSHLKPGVYLVELAGKEGKLWKRKVVKR
jgi:hypothetical protein